VTEKNNDVEEGMEIGGAISTLREHLQGGHPDFFEMTIDEIMLHNTKNADYAKGGNPLGNFYRVSDLLKSAGAGIPPSQVAFIYMAKQLDAAGRMMFLGYEGKVEGVQDRLRDVSVYAKLIRILYNEEQHPKA